MNELLEKADLLASSGYQYDPISASYVNKLLRRVVSSQFIDTYSSEDLQKILETDVPITKQWTFYFVEPPSTSFAAKLSDILDERFRL